MARRIVLLLAATTLSLGCTLARAAPAVAQPAPTADALVVKGQALAAERCARCHATGAIDVSPHAKAPPFRDVVTRYPSEHLAEALAEGIVSGHPDMPVYVMTPAEIDEFLAFLDTLSPPVPAKPGAAPSPR